MKRILSLLMCVCIFAAICIPSAAGIGRSAVSRVDFDILHSDMWNVNDARISNRYVNGSNAIAASPIESASDFRLWRSFDIIDLAGCSELGLSVSLRGAPAEYEISVVLGSGSYRSDAFVKSVKCVGIQRVYIPLTAEVAASLDYIEISVAGSELPIYVMIYEIFADNGFSYATTESFGSEDAECTAGTWKAEGYSLAVLPDSLGRAAVSMSFISDTLAQGTYAVRIDAACPASGSISLEAELNGEAVPTSKAQITSTGEYSYVFLVEGAFSRISFAFEGMSLAGEEKSLLLTHVGVLYAGKSIAAYDTGSVTSCKYENGRVAVRGELSEKAALEYVDSKLGLYVIPMWESSAGVLDREPDVISGFSTMFTIYVEPEEDYLNCMYQPVIVSGNKRIPISSPVMACSAPQGSAAQSSLVYGIDRASQTGAAQANADCEIIDIYTDRLLKTEDIYTAFLHIYRGDSYYFNKEYLDELSRRIDLASRMNVRLYARLSCLNGDGLGFNTNDKESMGRFCALCDCLKYVFYGKLHGYIMGNALNTSSMLSAAEIDKMSRLAAVFAEALRGAGTADIYLPVSAEGDVDPFEAYAALRYCMSKYSAVSVAMLYFCSKNIENAAASVLRVVSVANSYGYQTDGGAVIWRPYDNVPENEVIAAYSLLCRTAMTSELRFAALDVSGRKDSFYRSLKTAMSAERISSTNAEIFNATVENKTYAGTYTVKNFEASYDTTGWTAGGSFDGVLTEVSLLKDGRALRTRAVGNEGVGMLVYRFEEPMDMSKTDAAFSLGIVSDGEGVVGVTVIFGCGDSRKEYSTTVEYNRPSEILCDMGDSAAVDYAALIVHTERDCTLELYDVSLHSGNLTDEEMKDKYAKEQRGAPDPLLYVSVILLTALTVVVFSIFAKGKDK